jgi:18S rRNA (adenine1779-N6/adenine1780-N6)-dimethyltransferase
MRLPLLHHAARTVQLLSPPPVRFATSGLRSQRLQMRKQLGQHLLVNPDVVANIVKHAEIAPGERVFEIGPGTGNLTAHLLASPAATVYAVELDARMHAVLAPRMAALPGGVGAKLRCAWGDFLRVPLPAFDVLVANIPYQISSPVLRRLFAHAPLPSRAVIMFQREFAERMVARPGGAQYCRLSVNTQLLAEAKLVMRIAAAQFRPPPKVDSAVVLLRPRGWPPGLDFAEWDALLRACFNGKNKTLRSLLGSKTVLAALARQREGAPAEPARAGEGDGVVATAAGAAARSEMAAARADVLAALAGAGAEKWRANAMPIEAFRTLYDALREKGFRFAPRGGGAPAAADAAALFSDSEGEGAGAGAGEEAAEGAGEPAQAALAAEGAWDAYAAGEGAAAPAAPPQQQPHWRGGGGAALAPGGRRERGLLEEARGAAALAGWFKEDAARDAAAAAAPPPPLAAPAAAKRGRTAAAREGETHAEAMHEHRTARRKAVGKLWAERAQEA